MAKVVFTLLFLCLADVYSKKTILQDIEEHRIELNKKFSNTLWLKEYVKRIYDNPCDPYVPLIPDVSSLKTVSEIKCKEYMWRLKNQLLENTRQQMCESSKANTKFRAVNRNNTSDDNTDYGVGFGRFAGEAEFPHMGAVGWRSKSINKQWVFKCGSSLISEKFFLTAAHCTKISPRFVTDIVNGKPEVVKLGIEYILDDIEYAEREPKIVKILNILVHPDYQSPKKYNDIALLEVDDKIEFSQFIKPACVWPHENVTLQGEKVTVTGWGETESGNPSPYLQAGDVEILDSSTCDDVLKPFRNRNWNGFTDKQMCAGKPGGRVDTCQGDSGGPLALRLEPYDYDVESLYLVVGVTSFGIKCSVKDRPGVYTRVASYSDWIEKHVWNNTFE